MGQPTIPPGTYDCVVRAVEVRRRKKDGAWVLEVVVKAIHKDHELVVYQDLADADRSDGFDVTSQQCQSIVRFAERLGIEFDWSPPIGALPIRKLPVRLAQLMDSGEIIQASVTHGGGHQQIVLSRNLEPTASAAVAEWPDAEADSAPYTLSTTDPNITPTGVSASTTLTPDPVVTYALAEIVDVNLTETAWIPDGDMSYEQWEAAGRELQRMGRAWQWWVGDWLNYGERKYGEKYAQAVETTGWANQTLRNVSYVARQIEPSRRRDDLEWSHHAEVAALEPEEQDELLLKAAENCWTVRELRSRDDKQSAEKVECPTCGSKVKPEVLP